MSDKLLGIQKYLMMLTNKWEIRTRSLLFDKLCKMYGVFAECIAHLFTIYVGINLTASRRCPTVFYEVLGYFSHHVIALIIHAFLRKKSVKKSIQCIIDYEKVGYDQEDQSSKDIYDYHTKINILIDKYIMIAFTIVGCTFWYILTILHAIKINNEDCPLIPGSLYQIWYPFGEWFVILADLSMASLLASVHLVNRMYPVSLVLFQRAQIKMLSDKIGKVDAKAKKIMDNQKMGYDQAVNLAVNECIQRHQEIIRLMDVFQEAAKEMMLFGFFSSAVQITSFIIQSFTATSQYQTMRPLLLSPTDVLQILSFFWFANEVFVQSTALSDDIYNKLDWVNYNKPVRKKLIIMMMRAQKPLCFKGIGIGEMTLEKFKQIMKSCFSLITFFQTMYQN